MPRLYHPEPLNSGQTLALNEQAARHVQVLRLQPGDAITLFNGLPPFGEFSATVAHMGKRDVQVTVGAHSAREAEAGSDVHIVLGVPANERMDWLVEKATELGVASITPLLTARTVLKLSGERADKRREHWQAIAVASCEQCGRNRVPHVAAVQSLSEWLRQSELQGTGLLLSLHPDALTLRERLAQRQTQAAQHLVGALQLLSGPEGGLSEAEENAAMAKGFLPTSLGPRILRAETAPLAVLAALNLHT